MFNLYNNLTDKYKLYTVAIHDITYRNKAIDKGLILGFRQYRWQLKKDQRPLYAREMRKGGGFVNVNTKHKKNFTSYIPASMLRKGMKLEINNEGVYYRVVIKSIEGGIVNVKARKVEPLQNNKYNLYDYIRINQKHIYKISEIIKGLDQIKYKLIPVDSERMNCTYSESYLLNIVNSEIVDYEEERPAVEKGAVDNNKTDDIPF